jgi:hypothetical protein
MNDLTASKPIPFTKLALIKRFRVVDPDEMDDEENLHINDDDEMMSCVEKRVRNTCLYLSSHLRSSGLVTSHCSSSLELEDGTWISVWVPNHGASSICCGALVVTQD